MPALAGIVAALEAVAADIPAVGCVPYRALIPGIARGILLMRSVEDSPAATASVRKDLDSLHSLSTTLASVLQPTLDVPWDPKTLKLMALLPLAARLQAIHLAADFQSFAAACAAATGEGGKARKGRPAKAAAYEIAEALHREFVRLAGETVRGSKEGYLRLVQAVFVALDIPAKSARPMAKKVMAKNQELDAFKTKRPNDIS